MEELRRLEKLQSVVSAVSSHGLLTSDHESSSSSSSRFISELVLFLVQPCGDLDVESKLVLVSDFVPKVSGRFLDEISRSIQRDDEAKPLITSSVESQKSCVKRSAMDNVDPYAAQKDQQVVAMVGLDAMKRANSTLEDFSRSYFMFHQLEISEPQSIFRYLPVLSFTESYIYQMDALNEKIVRKSACESQVNICVEDVMRAIHLKSFDYRVLNLLLYKLRGVEDDVLENSFNVLRMFVGMFGPSNAPTELAKRISEAEEKYEEIMKSLDPHLSSNYQRRCEEATKEGGKVSGPLLGTWNIPAVISDEGAYRAAHR
uniref:Uncharacterized protein n=1 Tax=Brassica campestris TaxID=3711 RepID=M4CXU4_BRACM